MTYKISHSIHPNNETRLTLYKVRRVSLSLVERAAIALDVAVSEVAERRGDNPAPPSYLTFVPNSEPSAYPPLANSHARTTFGLSAKRRIFRAAGAMDRFDATRENYLFLTATLPGDTDEAKWGVAEYSHEIIDGLKSWLSKRLSSRLEFYVWENQRRGALHFHYCIHCPDAKIQENITANFKAQMVRLYDAVQEKHGCNLWGKWSDKEIDTRTDVLQARTEIVYSSVGAYMAGYLAGEKDKHKQDASYSYYPKRWFGVSRPLSDLIKTYTEEEEYEFESLAACSEYMAKIREDLMDDVLTFTDYPHKIGEGKTHVSYHTTENQQALWQARKMLTHSPSQHPNISAYVANALAITRNCATTLQRSKYLQEQLPPKCVAYLQDYSLLTSMKRGALSRNHIDRIQEMFSAYDWSLSSEVAVRRQYNSLRTFSLQTLKYRSQMTFNQFGWLSNTYDFVKPIDKAAFGNYAGTSYEDTAVEAFPDSYSGRVPSEPKECPFPFQTSLNL